MRAFWVTRASICWRTSFAALACICTWACEDPATKQRKAGLKSTYDTATGKLKELAYDSNGNGRFDTWTEMDGTRPVRSRIDLNEDGKIDRWEEYDADGALVKVGFSRTDNGNADAWAFSAPDGTLQRIEIASPTDRRRIYRWEYYDAAQAGGGRGALVRADEDTNGDGRPDKWETYEHGSIKTVAFDENGNGRPDRRLTYTDGRLVVASGADPAVSGARRTLANDR